MLRGYSARLRIQETLCIKLCPTTYLQRNLPRIHHRNTRLIQSRALNHYKSLPSIHSSQYKRTSHYHPLQQCNLRRFSLPEHEVIGLPALSPSVEESKIVSWKKNEGDFVGADEAIAIIQTDKAELDWQVTDDVYLAKILLQPGLLVPVGTPACVFVEEEKDIEAFKNYSSPQAQSTAAPTATVTPTAPTTTTSATPAPAASIAYPEHTVEGMPALSPTAEDGAVVEWLVKEGDAVEEGSSIAEIQTDKSVVTWVAIDDAYVAKLLVPVAPDNRLPVGTPLAVFVDEKDDVAAFKNYTVAAPVSTAKVTESEEATATATATTDIPKPPPTSKPTQSGRIFASPYAKKLAKEIGIQLDAVGSASGTGGRIVAADILKASQQSVSTPKPVVITGDRTYEDIPVSVIREIIGKRLSESKFTSPHFYVTMECLMDSLIQMRLDINTGEKDVKISVNDFIIKACAAALRETPDCNVGWIQDNNKAILRKYNYVDISVAVSTPAGLITPIIKDADRKSLSEISLEMRDLGKRAKENKLLPEEFQGGTFTISNMGMYGVTNFTAIINPPQACILAVGASKLKLVPDDSNPRGFNTVSAMEITLSSDHRSVDGALAAILVNSIQKYIEKPAKLML